MKTKNPKDNWNAEYYKKHSQGQFKRGISTLQEIKLHGNEHILDVGCGDGRITAEFAKKVPQGSVLGIDISPNMIAEAKKSFGDIKNLAFQCVDAAVFASDKKFDLAVSNATFHWIKDQTGALKNIYNHLKPGGKLIIKMTALHKGPVSQVQESQKWVALLSTKEQTHFPQTIESFSDMLKQCGFNNIDVKLNIVLQTFPGKEDLFNVLFAWVPHFTGLPDDKAREFTQDVVETVCNTRQDGQIIVETALLDARAIK